MTVKENGGTINTTQKDNVKEYIEVYFDEQDITKRLVLNNVNRNLIVTHGSSNYGDFKVHNPNR